MTLTHRRQRGFTLIELMVTLSLAAMFAFLAVPSMKEMLANQRMRSATDSLHASAMQARAVAMRDNRRVLVQPTAGADGAWKDGWRVFVDMNTNSSYDSGTDTLVLTEEAQTGEVTITKDTGTNNFFGYEGTGFQASIGGSANATWKITAVGTSRIRCLVIERTGRARVHDPFPNTTCPTS